MTSVALLPRSGVGVDPPYLVIAPQEPAIRVDLRFLDRVEVLAEDDNRSSLLLALGEYEMALYVADGLDACKALAAQCASYTRQSAPDVSISESDRDHFVIVGTDAVLHRGNCIVIGDLKYRLEDVKHYAHREANIPLHDGGLVQAAVALLVVAASEHPELLADTGEEDDESWMGQTVFRPTAGPEALGELDEQLDDHELAGTLVIGTERDGADVCAAFCVDSAGRVQRVSLEPPYVVRIVNASIEQFAGCFESFEASGRTMPRSNDDIAALRAKLIAIDSVAFEDEAGFWPKLLESLRARE